MGDPLLVVDGPSLLYRAFYALPDSIKGTDGRPVNALLGSCNAILRILADRPQRAVVICFGAEAAVYRKELFPSYHADRPPVPDGLDWQFEKAAAFFGAFGWGCADAGDLEADDLLRSYGEAEAAAGGSACLMTGDRDLYQCASDAVRVLYLKTGVKGFEDIGPAEVRARYGVDPELVPDFIALRGDPSDGLPGAPGIGEKTAAELLARHGSLQGVIDHADEERPRVAAALRDNAEQLLAFLDIATARIVEVERPPDTPTDLSGGAAAAREHGMNRLAERLEKAGSVAEL
jgi:DNA polymerase-1